MARRTIRVSLALAVIDALTGKPILRGAKVCLESGLPAIRKSDGYWVFVDLPPDFYTVIVEAPFYQKRKLQIQVGDHFSLMQVAMLPGKNFPFSQPVKWLEGEFSIEQLVWAALEEDPPRFRMIESFAKGAQDISLYFTGTAFSIQRIWIKMKGKKGKLFWLSPQPNRQGEYHIDSPLPWEIDHTAQVLPVVEVERDAAGHYEFPLLPMCKSICFVKQDGTLLTPKRRTGDE